MSEIFKIAIDGPGGAGKSTIAKMVAKRLGIDYIDTGAMYRCVALAALRKNINETEVEKVEEILKDIKIEFKREEGNIIVILNGEDV